MNRRTFNIITLLILALTLVVRQPVHGNRVKRLVNYKDGLHELVYKEVELKNKYIIEKFKQDGDKTGYIQFNMSELGVYLSGPRKKNYVVALGGEIL